MNKKAKIVVIILMIFGGFIGGFTIYGLTPPKPMEEAVQSLISDGDMQINQTNYLHKTNPRLVLLYIQADASTRDPMPRRPVP